MKNKKNNKENYPIPKDYAEHPDYHEKPLFKEEYIMHTQKTLPTSYLYYERIENQCKYCKYAEYNKPRLSKGTGWYRCRLGLNSRIKRYCFNYVEKKEKTNQMIKPLE